jgi:transposase-like protein
MALTLRPEEAKRLEDHMKQCSKYKSSSLLMSNPKKCEDIVRLYKNGTSVNQIRSTIGVAVPTIYKVLKAKGVRY